jgi:uncharacterized membrane protein YphA (DoxX/SURF4 family)
MSTARWIVVIILAAAFLASGALKLAWSREKLAARGMAWAATFPPAGIRAIGLAEIAAAVALILPPLLGPAEVLAPLAAIGLAGLMLAAAALHIRRREPQALAANAVFLALSAFAAWALFTA